MTLNSDNLDHLVKQISDLLPADLRQTREDLEKNLKAVMKASLRKMDLVTREEFDIQKELLANTRNLLEELALKIDTLESELNKKEN